MHPDVYPRIGDYKGYRKEQREEPPVTRGQEYHGREYVGGVSGGHRIRPAAPGQQPDTLYRLTGSYPREKVLQLAAGKVARQHEKDERNEAGPVPPLAQYPDEHGRDDDRAEEV